MKKRQLDAGQFDEKAHQAAGQRIDRIAQHSGGRTQSKEDITMQMYQIKVGNMMLKGEFTEHEAEKVVGAIRNCVLDEIELIPVKQGATV